MGKSSREVIFQTMRNYNRNLPLVRLSNHENSLFADETSLIENYQDPIFNYVPTTYKEKHDKDQQTNPLKLILVLDASKEMSVKDRWIQTRNSLYRLIGQLLPSGTELSIITFGEESAKIIITPTIIRDSNRQGLHGRIPFRLSGDDSGCIACGLETALNLIDSNKNSKAGGDHEIILISAKSYDSFLDLNSLRLSRSVSERIQEDVRPVHHVFFESTILISDKNSTSEIELFDFCLHGSENVIGDGSPSTGKKMHQKMSQVFLQILKKTFHGPSIECTFRKTYNWTPYHVDNEDDVIHLPVGQDVIKGTFVVEQTVSTNLLVILTTNLQKDIMMFELTSPSGQKFSFPKYDYGVVYFQLEKTNEAGVWSYLVKLNQAAFSSEDQQNLSLEVLGSVQSKGLASGDATDLDFWHKVEDNVVMLYARLSTHQGLLPIRNAKVLAQIQPPSHSTHEDVVEITLHDGGTGYPDLTRGDGIYSAYFTGVVETVGFYSVSLRVDSGNGESFFTKPYTTLSLDVDCCGSRYPDHFPIPTSTFSRYLDPPSFKLGEEELSRFFGTDDDVFPPGRVTDFRKEQDEDELMITLSWTSSGNDFSLGRADR